MSDLFKPQITTIEDAIQQQIRLQSQVRIESLDIRTIKEITALKATCLSSKSIGIAMRLSFPNMQIKQVSFGEYSTSFPYYPGLYTTCAAPALVQAIAQLNERSDVFIVEGHGAAHPRRFGLACYLGVGLDMPTFGCARTLLTGKMQPLAEEEGSSAEIFESEEVIGIAYLSKAGCKPVYLSVGHRMDLESVLHIAKSLFQGYRMPEPLRLANQYIRRSIQED